MPQGMIVIVAADTIAPVMCLLTLDGDGDGYDDNNYDDVDDGGNNYFFECLHTSSFFHFRNNVPMYVCVCV